MNLQQLRYFVTTAQLENISKAADVFHLSQSSLSKNILKTSLSSAKKMPHGSQLNLSKKN